MKVDRRLLQHISSVYAASVSLKRAHGAPMPGVRVSVDAQGATFDGGTVSERIRIHLPGGNGAAADVVVPHADLRARDGRSDPVDLSDLLADAASPGEFPAMPEAGKTLAEYRLPATAFVCAAQRVLPFVDPDRAGIAFEYVLLDAGPGGIRLVACDRHRLAIQVVSTTQAAPAKALLAPNLLTALTRFDNLGDQIELTLHEGGTVSLRAPNVEMRGQPLADASSYPDYEQVVPDLGRSAVTLDDAGCATLRRLLAELPAPKKSAPILLVLHVPFGRGDRTPAPCLPALLYSQDAGTRIRADVAPTTLPAKGGPIGFNAHYMRDALGSAGDAPPGGLRITCPTRKSDAVRIALEGDPAFTCVIMPLQFDLGEVEGALRDAARLPDVEACTATTPTPTAKAHRAPRRCGPRRSPQPKASTPSRQDAAPEPAAAAAPSPDPAPTGRVFSRQRAFYTWLLRRRNEALTPEHFTVGGDVMSPAIESERARRDPLPERDERFATFPQWAGLFARMAARKTPVAEALTILNAIDSLRLASRTIRRFERESLAA